MTTTVTFAQDGPLTANGTAPLPFTFQAISEEEITVLREGIEVSPTTYTVALSDGGTGSITPTSSWGTDEVYIRSAPFYGMPTEFSRHGAFYPDRINPGLDNLARQIIALKRRVDMSDAGESVLREDLLSLTGSENVNFVQAGAGAASRRLQDKLADQVSIKDFGATGDGVTNDRDAIQAALDSGAKTIVAPGGTYICTTGITIPTGVAFIGMGATIKVPIGVNAITMSDVSQLREMGVDGTDVDDTLGATGVLLGNDCRVTNVSSSNFGFHGFASNSGGSSRNVMIGCRAYNCGHRGLNLSEGSNYNRVTNFEARNCKRAGIIVGYLSNYNIISDVYIDGFSASEGGAGLWVHMNADFNEFANFQIGPQDGTGVTCPSVILGAGCKFNTFSHFKLHDVGTRGLYIWNQNTDHPEFGTFDTAIERNRFYDFGIYGTSVGDGVSFKSDDSEIIQNCDFDRFYIHGFVDAVEDLDIVTLGLTFSNFNFGTISGRKMKVGSITDNFRSGRRSRMDGLTGVGSLAIALTEYGAQPAVPATTVTQINYYPFPVNIFVQGLPAGSGVLIDGTNVLGTAPNNGNGMYTLLPGQTIALSYPSGTPTWRWWGMDW